MIFVDKPPPGRGYLLFLYLTLAFSLFIMVSAGSIVVANGEADLIFWLIMIPGMVFIILVFALILHGAYSTVYSIEGGVLKMSSGLINGTVELANIRGISKNGTVTTTVGWGVGSRSICNRFKAIVVLETGKEKVCVSPGNPDLFVEQLNEFLPHLADHQPTSSGGGR